MISSSKALKVSLYTPHSGQMLLHSCPARFRVMACGRRFGKTLAATNELAQNALTKPATLNWWIAPTYRQTEIAFELLSAALQPVLKTKPNRSKMRLDVINDAVIECRSAERYENMRGDGPNFVVFDEASKCPKAAWTEVVRPALADTQGRAIFISTPWGRDWFWELFMRGQDEREVDYWSKSFPTSANPFIPAAEIEEARRSLPARIFDQEFMARFHDDAAMVFHAVDRCAIGAFAEPVSGHHYVIGWDIAKYNDYSVFTVIDCATGHVVHWQRMNGLEYHVQIDQYLKPMAEKYNNAYVVMDSTGVGDPVLEQVRLRNISAEGYHLHNASKKELIDRTVVAIEQVQVRFPKIEQLITELKAYSYKITESKNIVYGAPEGYFDDCVISLGLAVYGAKMGNGIGLAITSSVPHEVPLETPEQETEDPRLILRQAAMARNLRMLQGQATSPVKIAPEDLWGIA